LRYKLHWKLGKNVHMTLVQCLRVTWIRLTERWLDGANNRVKSYILEELPCLSRG
jgi:hypothetical protein